MSMTSAPNQASVSVHDVPASNCVRPRTRIPFRLCSWCFLLLRNLTSAPTLSRRAREHRLVIVTEMAYAPRIDFTSWAHYDVGQAEAHQDFALCLHREGEFSVPGNQDAPQRLP